MTVSGIAAVDFSSEAEEAAAEQEECGAEWETQIFEIIHSTHFRTAALSLEVELVLINPIKEIKRTREHRRNQRGLMLPRSLR